MTVNVKQLFAYPFRIFFLSAAVWALTIIVIWTLQLSGIVTLPLAYPALHWHRHEMLYGFVSPAIAGFLLTAVCVWTKTNRMHGFSLVCLWGVWLAGRLLGIVAGEGSSSIVNGVNLLFLPCVIIDAGRRIIIARQWRHLSVLAALFLLWLMQVGLLTLGDSVFRDGTLMVLGALMTIIGGRITPAFSANWLKLQGTPEPQIQTHPFLEFGLMVTLAVLLVTLLLGLSPMVAVAASVAALLLLWRSVTWRPWLILDEPLLWILHLSLLWFPVALLLLVGHQLFQWPAVAWQHALGVGGVGGLVLGVMTRVALGHTARPLTLPAGVVGAYVAIQIAAVVRLLTAFSVMDWQWGVWVAAAAWSYAFAVFIVRYAGILCHPRVDGLPG